MTERVLRFVAIGSNDITFADPLSATRTTRFTHALTNVTSPILGNVSMHRAELISLRDVGINKPNCTDDCAAENRQISVRIKVSHPLAASAQAKQQVLDALENMRIAIEAGLTDGFLPTYNTQLVADDGVA